MRYIFGDIRRMAGKKLALLCFEKIIFLIRESSTEERQIRKENRLKTG